MQRLTIVQSEGGRATEIYENEAGCVDALTDKLQAQFIEPTLARKVAEALSEEFVTEQQVGGFGLRVGTWVIRDEDLNLLDAFATGVLAGFGAVAGGPIVVAVATACVAGAKLVWAASRKGITLSKDQQVVITALQTYKTGCTKEQLSQWLTENFRSGGWSPDKVSITLAQLEKIATYDGTVVAIAQKDGRGCWHAAGV